LSRDGLNKNEFERIKKVIFGRFLRQFNSVEAVSNNFMSTLFKEMNLFNYVDIYRSITFDDVQKRFTEHFNPDNMVLSVVRPYEG